MLLVRNDDRIASDKVFEFFKFPSTDPKYKHV